jgi:uncharacterized protein YndB with AHSA1/START domain
MPQANGEITIRRPLADVWAFLANAENDPRWRQGVIEMRRVSGDGVGARYEQRVRGPGGRSVPADIEITEFTPEQRIGFQTVAGPVRPAGRYELQPVADGTQVRFSLSAELRGAKRLMAPVVRRTMEAEVAGLERLRQVLEAGQD